MNNTLDLDADFDTLYEIAAAKFGSDKVDQALVEETCKAALEICHEALDLLLWIMLPEFSKFSSDALVRRVEVVVGAALGASQISWSVDSASSGSDRIEVSGIEIFKLAMTGRCSLRAAAANVVVYQSAEYIFESFTRRMPAHLRDQALLDLECSAKAELRQSILRVLEVEDLTEEYILHCRPLH